MAYFKELFQHLPRVAEFFQYSRILAAVRVGYLSVARYKLSSCASI